MTDCYSVHLIKRIVMTFHLFTFNIALVVLDESNEKTVSGREALLHHILFHYSRGSPKSHLPLSILGLRPECRTAVGSSLRTRPAVPHISMLPNHDTLLLRYLRATDLKNPEVK